MRKMRFLAFGIVSFVVAIVGTLLAPGTFVNRAFSAALCALFSFNLTVCTMDLGRSSQRVVAANPPAVVANIADYLQAQRDPSEFGDDQPSAPAPQQSNPQAPPFPQDPGPSFPVRREFDDPVDDAAADAANDIAAKFECDKNQKAPIYAVYVNGVNTPRNVYNQDKVLINNLLKDALGEKVSLSFDAYNYGGSARRIEGISIGDFWESLIQSSSSNNTGPGEMLIFQSIEKIKRIEKLHEDFAKTADCNCHVLKPKYLLIGHSQGNFFVEDIALRLPDKVKERTSILSIASFTSYEKVRKERKVKFEYLLRPDDFPLIAMKYVRDVESRVESVSEQQQPGVSEALSTQTAIGITRTLLSLLKKVYTPGGTNVSSLNDHPLLNKKGLNISDLVKEENFVLMLDAHLIENYIGNPTKGTGSVTFPSFDAMRQDRKLRQPLYESKVLESYNKAKQFLTTLTDYPSEKYPKDAKECSPTAEQPQQTAQQQVRNCRIRGVEQYNNITMNRGECAIQGAVMTVEGLVDGKTQCGVCNTIIGNLPPNAGSCKAGMETDPRIAFLGLNKPILCPPNWDSGW